MSLQGPSVLVFARITGQVESVHSRTLGPEVGVRSSRASKAENLSPKLTELALQLPGQLLEPLWPITGLLAALTHNNFAA